MAHLYKVWFRRQVFATDRVFIILHHHIEFEVEQSRWEWSEDFQLFISAVSQESATYRFWITIFKSSKVFWQLTDKQCYDPVWSLSSLPQYKWSRLKCWSLFQVLDWHWAAICLYHQHEVQDDMWRWRKSSLGWKKQNKSIREIAKTLVAKSMTCYILKKRMHWWAQQRRHQLMRVKSFPLRRKKTSQSRRVKNSLKKVGVSLSNSTIKRPLHEFKYSRLTSWLLTNHC